MNLDSAPTETAGTVTPARLITKAVLDIGTLTWDSVESELYTGPWARCDRSAQSQGKTAASNAGSTAASEQGNANNAQASLTPFYKQEMNAQHLYTPDQTNELLGYAGAATGGTGATAMGEANSEAARTRNTSGFSSALDATARDRQRQLSEANLGVGAQDIMGAKQLNQEGAAGTAGLNQLDTDAMLKSMGLQNQDINTQIDAGKSGWLQSLNQTLGSVGGLIGNLKK